MICTLIEATNGELLAGPYLSDAAFVPQVGQQLRVPGHAQQQVVSVIWEYNEMGFNVHVVCSPRPPRTFGYGEIPHDPF